MNGEQERTGLDWTGTPPSALGLSQFAAGKEAHWEGRPLRPAWRASGPVGRGWAAALCELRREHPHTRWRECREPTEPNARGSLTFFVRLF